MTARPPYQKQNIAFVLLGILMVFHLAFLGFIAKYCGSTLAEKESSEQCGRSVESFQRASETYVAILLALMAPTPGR